MSGNKVFDHIDRLTEARTTQDLAERLQPILRELAYSAVMGEAGVLDAHEAWHDRYTDALNDEAGTGVNKRYQKPKNQWGYSSGTPTSGARR